MRPVSERRAARFPVVSAALSMFRERKANTLRHRGRREADRMRFAGEEAALCLKEARIKVTEAAFLARQAELREQALRAMSDEAISVRLHSIGEELYRLPFSNGFIRERRSNLEAERKMLESEADRRRFKAMATARNIHVAEPFQSIINAFSPHVGEQPAADAMWSDGATDAALDRV